MLPIPARLHSAGAKSWRTLLDSIPAAIFTARSSGEFEFVNQRFQELYARDPDDHGAASFGTYMHRGDRGAAISAWEESVERGRDFSLAARIRTVQGPYAHVHGRATALRDDDGKIVRWLGVLVDRDDYARTTAERRFQAVAESLPLMCWTADVTGWIDWYNRHWYEFTGQTAADAAGWGWQAALHPDDFLGVMKNWPRSIATGEPFEMEFRLRRFNGVFHWFLTRAEPSRAEDGKVERWYGANVDIDAQKRELQRSFAVADALREAYVPRDLPQVPGIRIDGVHRPVEIEELVGGDWFDAFQLPDGRLFFSIGDVAGHGLELSGVVARLRQSIYTLAFVDGDPAAILSEAGRILRHQHRDTFATALVGFVDFDSSKVIYSSAGHPPPLVARSGEMVTYECPMGDAALGFDVKQTRNNHAIGVVAGSIMVLYTDGMIEFARDPIAGAERLRTAVALFAGDTHVAKPATALQELVFEGTVPSDDATVLTIQFLASGELPPLPESPQKMWRFHASDVKTARAVVVEVVAYLREGCDLEDPLAAELAIGEILGREGSEEFGVVEVHVSWPKRFAVLLIRDNGPERLHEAGRSISVIERYAQEVSVIKHSDGVREIRAILPSVRREG